jgi:CRP/FNR family transcriptional regulator, cyclic AMP receptor protein
MSAPTDPYLPSALAHAGPRLHVPTGWPLSVEGDRGVTAYLVMSGTLRVHRDGQDIARIGPGELAGERALLEGTARNASLTAITPVEVVALDEASFDYHRRTVPALRDHLDRAVAVR